MVFWELRTWILFIVFIYVNKSNEPFQARKSQPASDERGDLATRSGKSWWIFRSSWKPTHHFCGFNVQPNFVGLMLICY